MTKIELKIKRPIYNQTKRVKSDALKVGDRFMHKDYKLLCFKLNLKPKDNHYLCCTESGITFWLDGDEKVERLNGVAGNLWFLSMQFIKEFNRQEKLRKQGVQPTF